MKNRKQKVFRDSEQDISSWSKDILVKCPSCNKRATLKSDVDVFHLFLNTNSSIQCANCGLTLNQNELTRYKLELKKNCSKCGFVIKKVIPSLKREKDSIKVACENCGDTQEHKPRNIVYKVNFPDQAGINDPIFGVSLWFQDQYKGNILYAFNYDHLQYLKDYVSADLREREGMTRSARLPKFIKDKKNRKGLLKIIDRMWMQEK